jgi:hypothetical protein
MKELIWNTGNPDEEGLYICDLGPYAGVQLGRWTGDVWILFENKVLPVWGWLPRPKYKQKDNG